MNFRKILLFIGLFLLLIVVTVFSYLFWENYKHRVNCPEISKDYSEFLPYSKGDKIYFKSNDRIKELNVDYCNLNHTKSYDNRLLCGCCEDGAEVRLSNSVDTIYIYFDNYKNPNSCFGESITLDYNDGNRYMNDKKFKIVRFKGLTSFTKNDTAWELNKIKQINNKADINILQGCD